VIASPVAHGWLMVWAKRIVVLAAVYESGGLRGGDDTPHQTLIMPLLDMFRSRRSHSTSSARPRDGYLDEYAPYGQASAYPLRPTAGFGRAAHHAPPHTGNRAQHYPAYGPSFSNTETSADEQVRSERRPVPPSLPRGLIFPCHFVFRFNHKNASLIDVCAVLTSHSAVLASGGPFGLLPLPPPQQPRRHDVLLAIRRRRRCAVPPRCLHGLNGILHWQGREPRPDRIQARNARARQPSV
jgi:hypothetical protein